MTRTTLKRTLTTLYCAGVVTIASAAAVSGQTAAAPGIDRDTPAALRAEALIGLARVARDGGDFATADRRFSEAGRLIGFDAALRREHFGVISEVDAARAMRTAQALAVGSLADVAIFDRWIDLAVQARDPQSLADAAARAQRALPRFARWPRRLGESLLQRNRPREAADAFSQAAACTDGTIDDVAMRAIALERAGDQSASAAAWLEVPAAVRRQRADWWASALRARAVSNGRAVLAGELVEFVTAHPDDAEIRALAVEALADAQRPVEALAVLTAGRSTWRGAEQRRREAQLAAATGQRDRAEAAYRDLDARGLASDEDRWQLLALIAPTAPAADVLARLTALHSGDGSCRDRALAVADLSGADEIAAWLVAARPQTCPIPGRLALSASRWKAAHGDQAGAEALLTRSLAAEPGDRAATLALVGHLLARGDGVAAATVLDRYQAAPGATDSFDLTIARAWTLAASGRAADAWALAATALRDRALAPGEAATWAGLALGAGADADADRLARAALDSDADLAARHVLASLAQRHGDPGAAYRWLAPVAGTLTTDAQWQVWLEAVAALRGPAVALAEAERRSGHPDMGTPAGVELAAAFARFAASLGDASRAEVWIAAVRSVDADRASWLDLESRVADGRAAEVVRVLSAPDVSTLDDDRVRLLLTASLDSGAWPAAEAALAVWQQRGLDPGWRLLKRAELGIKRDGRLSDEVRRALQQVAAAEDGGPAEARVRLAQDASARGAHDQAVTLLGGGTLLPLSTPLAVRRALVDVLARAGRPADVLIAVPDDQPWPGDLLSARIDALVALDRRDEARGLLDTTEPHRRTVGQWHQLAALTEPVTRREAVLVQALTVVPDARQAPLLAAMATVRQQLGQPVEARRTALRALELDQDLVEAWRIRLAIRPETMQARLDDLTAGTLTVSGRPDAAADLAEAAISAGPLDAREVEVLQEWLRGAVEATPARALRLRVRLGMATGDWPLALDALAVARRGEPDDRGLQLLEAQVLAWSGDHPAAAPRFAAYLAAVPDDASAWREYGRLLSWMQQPAATSRAYAEAARLAPAPALDAETRTKAALARQAWRTAADAAADWQAREPASLDAITDRAVALDRAGHLDEAALLFRDLAAARALPADLRRAAVRYGARHRPEAGLAWTSDAAEGYGGQQRLDQRQTLGSVADRVGPGGAMRLFASVGRGTLDARVAAWDMTTLRAGADGRLGRGWQASGLAGLTWLAGGTGGEGVSRTVATVQGSLARNLRDGLRLGVAAEHRPFWENGATVQSGIMATGGGAHLGWQPSAGWALETRATAQALTDGNRRHEYGGSLAWRAGRGDRDLELRSSAFLVGYRTPTAAYFSPASFMRTDVEGEVRQWFGRPRYDGDRRAYLAAGLGVGVDSRQARYGLGLAKVSIPVGAYWSLVAEGRWVQAAVYDSTRAGVWLQIGK